MSLKENGYKIVKRYGMQGESEKFPSLKEVQRK